MTEYELTKKQLMDVVFKIINSIESHSWEDIMYHAVDIEVLAEHLDNLKKQGSPGSTT